MISHVVEAEALYSDSAKDLEMVDWFLFAKILQFLQIFIFL